MLLVWYLEREDSLDTKNSMLKMYSMHRIQYIFI